MSAMMSKFMGEPLWLDVCLFYTKPLRKVTGRSGVGPEAGPFDRPRAALRKVASAMSRILHETPRPLNLRAEARFERKPG